MSYPGIAIEVGLNGQPLDDDLHEQILSATVDLSVGEPGEFEIEFNDPQLKTTASKKFALGGEITIKFRDSKPSGPDDARVTAYSKVMVGEITEISAVPGDYPRLVLRGYDLSHRLQHGIVNTTYSKMDDGAIFKKIASRHGLTVRVKAQGAGREHEYLLQASSDFDMLEARTADLGLTWTVVDKSIEITDMQATDQVGLEWGNELLHFSVRATAMPTADEATVQFWDSKTQTAMTETAEVKQGRRSIGTDAPAVAAMFKAMGSAFEGNIFQGTATPQDAVEAKALAQAIAGQAAAQQFSGEGETSGTPKLRPGGEARVTGVDALDGVYKVIGVTHEYLVDESYTTRFAVGTAPRTGLADLLSRSQKDQEKWSRTGLVVGTVTSLKDPNNQGRVRVQFPTLGDDDESAWARIVSPGAGNERGMAVTPEIDDEVIVGFEHGDTRKPFVLGGVWSDKNRQPKGILDAITDEEVLARTWQSRLGHKITFLDGDDDKDKAIELELSDGLTKVHLGLDEVTITSPTDITVKGDKDINFEAAGDFNVKAKNISLEAQEKVGLDGANIAISGKQDVKTDAPTCSVTAKAKLELSSNGVATLKGSMVSLN